MPFTTTATLTNLVEVGYDKFLKWKLRSSPIFRQFVDVYPSNLTNPGPSVFLPIAQEIAALATTPLAEATDVTEVAAPDVNRVQVDLNEYGNAVVATLRLKGEAFIKPDPMIANQIGKNMVDTMDSLVKAKLDAATRKIGRNSGTLRSELSGTPFAVASVTGTDTFTGDVGKLAVTRLRRDNVHGIDDMDSYIGIIHTDIQHDLLSDSGWLNPHNYVDPHNLYKAEIGSWLGARYVVTPRCTVANDGAASATVYRSYFLGREALVEYSVVAPHVVIGPQTDKLKRFFPIGWYAHLGHALFRTEASVVAFSAATVTDAVV